jgi:hypothetical protein
MITLENAIQKIQTGEADCILVAEKESIIMPIKRGISPLVDLYKQHASLMNNASLVDKIVGRAASFIAILGHVQYVHAHLMSESALTLLKEYNIKATYDQLTPNILNRQQNNLCPMELAVQKINNPQEALEAIQKKMEELQSNNMHYE